MQTNKNENGDRALQAEQLFLRPVALIVVSIIFIASILFMGIFSIERTGKILSSFIEARCVSSANLLEKIAQESLNIMVQESASSGKEKFIPFGEEQFSPEKILAATIGEKAKEIDNIFRTKNNYEELIGNYAKDNNLRMVIFFNDAGNVVFQSTPMPRDFFSSKAQVVEYKFAASLPILDSLAKFKKISFIALQRKDKSGTVVVVLDDAGLRYWGIKVAVERAIREMRHGQGFEYLKVFDTSKKPIGHTGEMANETIADEKLYVERILNNSSARTVLQLNINDKNIVGMFLPLTLNGKRMGVIHIGIGWGGTDKILEEYKRNIFIFVLFTAMLTMLSLFVFYHGHKQHISKTLDMERQLEKAERLSSLGKLAAGVAHEIRNPLNAISMATQRMKRDFAPADPLKQEEFSSLTVVIRDEIRRLDAIIEEFLKFSKTRRLDIKQYPLSEILQKIVSLLSAQAEERAVTLETRFDNSILIPIDADKFQQAMLNIVKNAMESIPANGVINITTTKEISNAAKIFITDTGCGMSQREIEQIFNPEYTTKEKGLGLGLTLSHEIIRGHGGRINIHSEENKGTIFEITMPLEMKDKNAG